MSICERGIPPNSVGFPAVTGAWSGLWSTQLGIDFANEAHEPPQIVVFHGGNQALQAALLGIAEARRLASDNGSSAAYNIDKNPIYQQMRLSMAQLEADVSAKRRLLAEYEQQIAELEGDHETALERIDTVMETGTPGGRPLRLRARALRGSGSNNGLREPMGLQLLDGRHAMVSPRSS